MAGSFLKESSFYQNATTIVSQSNAALVWAHIGFLIITATDDDDTTTGSTGPVLGDDDEVEAAAAGRGGLVGVRRIWVGVMVLGGFVVLLVAGLVVVGTTRSATPPDDGLVEPPAQPLPIARCELDVSSIPTKR